MRGAEAGGSKVVIGVRMCGCARMQADANRMSGYGLGADRSRGVRSDDVEGGDMSKTDDVSGFGVRG